MVWLKLSQARKVDPKRRGPPAVRHHGGDAAGMIRWDPLYPAFRTLRKCGLPPGESAGAAGQDISHFPRNFHRERRQSERGVIYDIQLSLPREESRYMLV